MHGVLFKAFKADLWGETGGLVGQLMDLLFLTHYIFLFFCTIHIKVQMSSENETRECNFAQFVYSELPSASEAKEERFHTERGIPIDICDCVFAAQNFFLQ